MRACARPLIAGLITKPEIALEQIAKAYEDGIPPGVVLMDAGYGVNTALRDGVTP